MSSLEIGLIVAGAVLVIGVLIYNWWEQRRVRARIDETFSTLGKNTTDSARAATERIEPSLKGRDTRDEPLPFASGGAAPANVARAPTTDDSLDDFVLPVQVQARMAVGSDAPVEEEETAAVAAPGAVDDMPVLAPSPVGGGHAHEDAQHPQPDPDIECIVALQPTKAVQAGALAAGLHARLGKRLRWFGRRGPSTPWQLLRAETPGEFTHVVACLLLADRTGAASVPMLEAFAALLADVAPSLPASFIAPDVNREAARAETLDRICADLDVQIGLTVLKNPPATIPGTRLRGVAEAAGFRLAGGRFEWVQEETGAVLYALQNFRADPFTPDNLRASSTPGAVFLLDVPRVTDPARVFDHMKLAAKRMAQTLEAALVDDNRRPLDDNALAAIRVQIQKTAAGLQAVHIEPGSPRALALFGG